MMGEGGGASVVVMLTKQCIAFMNPKFKIVDEEG